MKQHTHNIQIYFDKNAQSWHDYYMGEAGTVGMVISDRLRIGLEMIKSHVPAGGKILDAGCGAGLASIDLAENGYLVTGIDVSEKMIVLANENLAKSHADPAHCSFSIGDVLAMDIPAKSLDAILGLGFIQYQEDEVVVLKHLNTLLKEDGILVLSGPVKRQLTNYLGFSEQLRGLRRWMRGEKKKNLLHEISVNSYSISRFRKILKESGFKTISYRGHGYVHFQFIGPRLGQERQIALHHFFTRLSKFLPIQPFGNDMVVLAKTGND